MRVSNSYMLSASVSKGLSKSGGLLKVITPEAEILNKLASSPTKPNLGVTVFPSPS